MKVSQNMLLVEGATEKRLIPELIEHRGIKWKDSEGSYIAHITEYGGITNMLAPGEIETALKSSGLKSLGLIFDADGLHGETQRWPSVRKRCQDIGCEPPQILAPGGYVTTLPAGIRFGVWMMPNNLVGGMLETFLQSLVPDQSSPVYLHAKEATQKAASLGAPFKEAHFDKALIHAWLAWQDAPGYQLHDAVKFKILDPHSPQALPFELWFRTLFLSATT
jgi:hypothetical protein